MKGAKAVRARYAQQILTAIERDGCYVRVPAGKQVYLSITQTVDEHDAKIGGTMTAALNASEFASPAPSPAVDRPLFPPTTPDAIAPLRDPLPSTSQPTLNR